MGNRASAEPDFGILFEQSRDLSTVLDLGFRILAASDAYLRATLTRREGIVGRYMFDVFPDNPDDPSADAVRNSLSSFNRVLQTGEMDIMPVQRYDVRRPDSEGGGFEARYWSSMNSPVLTPDGSIAYILHRVEDLTERVLMKLEGEDQARTTDAPPGDEDLYRMLFEHMGEGVLLGEIICDESGKPVDYLPLSAGPAPERILGMKREDIVGKVRSEALSIGSPWIGILGEVALSGQRVTVEGFSAAFSRHFSVCVCSPKPGQFACITSDITESKNAEEAVRASEARLRSVLDSSRDVIYRVNLQTGRYEYISPSAETVVGYSPDELMALDCETSLSMVHPDDLPAMRAALAHAEDTGEGELVYRQRAKSGDYRWMSNHVSVLNDADGRPLYRNGDIRDIGERKQAEDALMESEERFRTMADSAPALIWVTDDAGRNQFVNRTYIRYFAVTFEQAQGDGWQPLFHRDDAPAYVNAFLRCVSEHAPFSGEARVRRGDGEWRWLASHAEPRFSSSGTFLGHIGISLDITDRKQVEEALAAARDLLECQVRLLQRALIPASPRITDGYSVASRYIPAFVGQEIGGDFLDVFMAKDGRVGILIGDVSGKGIEAASLAATTRSTVRAFAYDSSSPSDALTQANSLLFAHQTDCRQFATSFLAILDPATGDISYCNAGHPAAIVSRGTGGTELLCASDMPLGVQSDTRYIEGHCAFGHGDKLVLFTDGVTEARHDGLFFGTDGVENVLSMCGRTDPDGVMEAILYAARDWAHGESKDDTTILIIAREA